MDKYTYTRFDLPLFSDDQDINQCKKRTPNYIDCNRKKRIKQRGFKVNDIVVISLGLIQRNLTFNKEYKFDSYDSYDNTCFIADQNSGMTYNVLLTEIKLVNK
jgi:hypothetical protein